MSYLVPVFIFVFGAIIGSFLNVCIYRIPRRKSIIRPGSFCPGCEKPVRFFDNIPIISYIILGGKCRHCKTKISIRYPFVELLTAVLFLMLYNRWGLGREMFIEMSFIALLIVIAFIDYDFQIIPDVLSIGGLVLGLLISFVRQGFGFMDALYGVLLGGGVLFVIAYGYQLITKREGMGGGDIKLLAAIGAFTGIKGVLFSLIGGSVLGTIVGIPLMLIKKENMKYAVPFGPFLSIAAGLYLFIGNNTVQKFAEVLFSK